MQIFNQVRRPKLAELLKITIPDDLSTIIATLVSRVALV